MKDGALASVKGIRSTFKDVKRMMNLLEMPFLNEVIVHCSSDEKMCICLATEV